MDTVELTLGPFRVLSGIAAGAMARVVLAEVQTPTRGLAAGQRVALKLIHPHLLASPEFVIRFLREADAGRRVLHPNVVRTLAAGTVVDGGEDTPYIAMEFVEGGNLLALRKAAGRLPDAEIRRVGREVALGLAAVHAQGIVHRDLKPENVLCTPGGEVKVADFGVARVLQESARLSREGQFFGSALYASPEHFRDLGDAMDGRSDLYSLGWILYTLAAGSHPLEGNLFAAAVMEAQVRGRAPDLRSENPEVTPFLAAVVASLLEKDPDRRFPSAASLADTLDRGEDSEWWRERAGA